MQETERPHSESGWSTQTKITLGAVLVILIIGLWTWWEPIIELVALLRDQETVSNYVQDFGAWGPLVLAIAQFIQVLFAFIPGHVFLVAAGYVYGFVGGFLLNLASTVLASQACYLLAREAGRPLVTNFVDREVIDRWEDVANEKGFVFFTIAFLLPVFPSDAMNFVAGLSGINARLFLAANFLGRFPSAIVLTLIGSHGLEMPPLAWAGLAIANVILFLVGRYAVNRLQASVRERRQPAQE